MENKRAIKILLLNYIYARVIFILHFFRYFYNFKIIFECLKHFSLCLNFNKNLRNCMKYSDFLILVLKIVVNVNHSMLIFGLLYYFSNTNFEFNNIFRMASALALRHLASIFF